MKTKLSLLAALAVIISATTGCAVKHTDLETLSSGAEIKPEVMPSKPYPLQGMLPEPGDYDRLRVYIEGDGRAWATRRNPSNDPTPSNSLVATLAITDKRPSVYLARPCQFVMTDGCNPKLWTDKRFGPEVLATYESALNGLKARYNTTQFELVGHSGGGAIALLLAAKRDDVIGVQTIAGNLDTEAWVKVKKLSPLNGSENPAQHVEKLKDIPQRHIIGANDTVMPAVVTQVYMTKLQGSCAEVVEVNADHLEGFEQPWQFLNAKPYGCLSKQEPQPKPSMMVGNK